VLAGLGVLLLAVLAVQEQMVQIHNLLLLLRQLVVVVAVQFLLLVATEVQEVALLAAIQPRAMVLLGKEITVVKALELWVAQGLLEAVVAVVVQ
jgi:hypothetical protein